MMFVATVLSNKCLFNFCSSFSFLYVCLALRSSTAAIASRTTRTSPNIRSTSVRNSPIPSPSWMLNRMYGVPSNISSNSSMAPSTVPKSIFETTSIHGRRGNRERILICQFFFLGGGGGENRLPERRI